VNGRKEPSKEEVELEPRRELQIEVNPLVLGRSNGAQGLRGERAREKRRAREMECG
jgi:hypothetical protein